MDSNGIKAAIEWLIGEPVARLNMSAGIVRMESGDQYSVNPDQIEMFAIKVDGTIVKYVKETSKNVDITGLTNGDVYLVNGYVKTVDDGKITIAGPVTKDYDVESAYSVSGLTADITSDDVSNGYAVAGETITITFSEDAADGYNILVDGDIVAEVAPGSTEREVEVEVNGDVTITKKVVSTDLATLLKDNDVHEITLEPGEEYTLNCSSDGGIKINRDLVINGNGATITTVGGQTRGNWAITIEGTSNLVINDVNFVSDNSGIALKQQSGNGYTVTLDGCSFTGYTTSVQLFHIKSGEITNCEFNSKSVDISISYATDVVVIEDNNYTEGLAENIGIGGNWDQIGRVTVNDDDPVVHKYYENV